MPSDGLIKIMYEDFTDVGPAHHVPSIYVCFWGFVHSNDSQKKGGGGCHELPRKILKLEEMKQRERTARSGEREKGVKGDMNW